MKAYLIILDDQGIGNVVFNCLDLVVQDSGTMTSSTITTDRMTVEEAMQCIYNDASVHSPGPEYIGECAPFDFNDRSVLPPHPRVKRPENKIGATALIQTST